MNELLQESINVLCDEVGLPSAQPDERGLYRIVIDGHELRVLTDRQGRVVVLGVIGTADALAEKRRESLHELLTSCLVLQAARFNKLGTREVLTIEPESGELILWISFGEQGVSIPGLLSAAESLLNELEFWKSWLANA